MQISQNKWRLSFAVSAEEIRDKQSILLFCDFLVHCRSEIDSESWHDVWTNLFAQNLFDFLHNNIHIIYQNRDWDEIDLMLS